MLHNNQLFSNFLCEMFPALFIQLFLPSNFNWNISQMIQEQLHNNTDF